VGMSTVDAQRHLSGLGLVGLYCLAIGVVLVLTGLGTVVARRQRGTEARGQIRVQERIARPQMRLGAGLAGVGLVLLVIWWIALR
jgi:hypothetical protein